MNGTGGSDGKEKYGFFSFFFTDVKSILCLGNDLEKGHDDDDSGGVDVDADIDPAIDADVDESINCSDDDNEDDDLLSIRTFSNRTFRRLQFFFLEGRTKEEHSFLSRWYDDTSSRRNKPFMLLHQRDSMIFFFNSTYRIDTSMDLIAAFAASIRC